MAPPILRSIVEQCYNRGRRSITSRRNFSSIITPENAFVAGETVGKLVVKLVPFALGYGIAYKVNKVLKDDEPEHEAKGKKAKTKSVIKCDHCHHVISLPR